MHLLPLDGVKTNPVPFLVANLGPDVDPFILHLFAALAEKERAMIGTRTKPRCGVSSSGAEAG